MRYSSGGGVGAPRGSRPEENSVRFGERCDLALEEVMPNQQAWLGLTKKRSR